MTKYTSKQKIKTVKGLPNAYIHVCSVIRNAWKVCSHDYELENTKYFIRSKLLRSSNTKPTRGKIGHYKNAIE